MEDRSNIKKNWYEFGAITKTSEGWIIKDLLVRWNERQKTRTDDTGAEFVYDAYRFDYRLPTEVQPGMEAIAYYFSLESTKSAVIQLAQDLAAQEVGFKC